VLRWILSLMEARPRPFVLLVGGDDAAARSCARAAAPLPVLRATYLRGVPDRLRTMRPIALVLAPDVPDAEALELTRIAIEQAARVLPLDRFVGGGARALA
jgi:hypothetical protein